VVQNVKFSSEKSGPKHFGWIQINLNRSKIILDSWKDKTFVCKT
jgi:hypothetical protein